MNNDNGDAIKSQGTNPAHAGLSVTCPQCGAGIAYDQGRAVRVCPFCGSAMAVPAEPVTRWLIRPALSRSDCSRLLSAWLWENYHGAARGPEIVAQEWIAWRYDPRASDGTGMVPRPCLADPSRYPELHDLRMPAGEQIPFSADEARSFELPPQPASAAGEQAIYLPAYIASFTVGQQRERAVIEAASGKVRGYLQRDGAARLRRWAAFAVAALVLAAEAFAIRDIAARLIVTGLSYAGLEIALGLVWEGLLWRK
ncbi:MAG TPA: hypothetical protein VMF29_06880 [Candidatus Edwardsbacteria bacterium]|nr:hypothetical protein [Candidatus Edwardsbacteria bacterium]